MLVINKFIFFKKDTKAKEYESTFKKNFDKKNKKYSK